MESSTKTTFFGRMRAFLFKNQNSKQTVAKNSFWLTVSNFGGRLIKAGLIIYGARVLGTSSWGVFSYAITLAGFLTLFMDPGINNILMRDLAKADDTDRRKIFSTAFALKIVLILIGAGVIVFVAPYFSTLPGARVLLPIVAVILAFDTLRDFFTSVARAMEKMEFDAAIFLLTNLGILIFGFWFLAIHTSPESLGWAYVVGDALGITLAVIIIRAYFKKIITYFSPALVVPLIQTAWPFAVAGALGLLLTNADILIISWLRTASDVGIYSSAIRIIQSLYLIPTVLQFSTLPLFSRLAKHDNERFRAALERTIGLVFLASVPLALGGAILGTQIMTLLFGAAYAPGGPSFSILMLGLVVDFSAVVISSAVFSYNHQRSLIVTTAIAGITNVAFDLLLIPIFGIAGSALATFIAQIASNWYLWHAMKKINYFEGTPQLKRIILAGILMACVTATLYYLHVNVIVNVIICIIVYFGLLRLVREPLLIEIKRLLFPAAEAPGVA